MVPLFLFSVKKIFCFTCLFFPAPQQIHADRMVITYIRAVGKNVEIVLLRDSVKRCT